MAMLKYGKTKHMPNYQTFAWQSMAGNLKKNPTFVTWND
jgi:hypothetical protein